MTAALPLKSLRTPGLAYLGSLRKWMVTELPDSKRNIVEEQEFLEKMKDRKLWGP